MDPAGTLHPAAIEGIAVFPTVHFAGTTKYQLAKKGRLTVLIFSISSRSDRQKPFHRDGRYVGEGLGNKGHATFKLDGVNSTHFTDQDSERGDTRDR